MRIFTCYSFVSSSLGRPQTVLKLIQELLLLLSVWALVKILNFHNVLFARSATVGTRPIAGFKLVEMSTFGTFPQLNKLHGYYLRLGLLLSFHYWVLILLLHCHFFQFLLVFLFHP